VEGSHSILNDELTRFINEIKSKKLYEYDEATTKQTIILKIFSLFHWNIFDSEEVKPEYSVGRMSVDYALRLQGQNKIFVEVKRATEDLGRHQEQLLNYSFQEGVKLAILTNGVTWWFYLPLQEASWEQRKFDSIDIKKHRAQEVSEKFFNYLLRENINSGSAFDMAIKVYQDRRRQIIIESTLSKSWEKVVNEKNDSFIDLLNKTIEEMCGFRASKELITEFIREHKSQILIPGPTPLKGRKREKPEPRRKRRGPMTMGKLFEKGILREGFRIFADYLNERYEAEIISHIQIRLLSDGSIHTSLSAAGTHITHYPVNGWIFWKCIYKGRECSLDELRKEDP